MNVGQAPVAHDAARERGPQVRGLVTRRLLLLAAGDQFAEHGFHGTTLSAVLAAAGVTKGSLYFHFATKEALAEAVIEQMVAGWHTVLAEVEAIGLDPLHTALAASDRVIAAMLEDPIARGGNVLLRDPALSSRAAVEHWAFGEAALTGQFRAAAGAGLLRAGLDPALIARSVIAEITGHTVMCDRTPDRPGLWEAVTDTWCGLLPAIATEDWVTAWAGTDWPRRPRPHPQTVQDGSALPDPGDRMIQTITMFEGYLPPAQHDWFRRRRLELGRTAWQAAMRRWPGLITRVRAEMDEGTDPAGERVQQLVVEWDQLVTVFVGDDPQVRAAVVAGWRAVWSQHAEHLSDSAQVVPPDMRDYIQRARHAR